MLFHLGYLLPKCCAFANSLVWNGIITALNNSDSLPCSNLNIITQAWLWPWMVKVYCLYFNFFLSSCFSTDYTFQSKWDWNNGLWRWGYKRTQKFCPTHTRLSLHFWNASSDQKLISSQGSYGTTGWVTQCHQQPPTNSFSWSMRSKWKLAGQRSLHNVRFPDTKGGMLALHYYPRPGTWTRSLKTWHWTLT